MHQALYRKWRPATFDEVCGQEHITSVLKYEAMSGNFSHAYLFCGSRGTGKTTCAKILSRAVNCHNLINGNPCGECEACRSIENGSATDVLEMDAASNNGVEDIRDIRDEVIYAPSGLKYRVYIIDEVHMLSVSAFNALLKTLEEPPSHVIFILATTELHKLPATIVSRCQKFDFRRISTDVLASRLMYIAGEEKLVLDSDAARLIARQAQGGMRDAISLLELCAGSRVAITPKFVEDTIGSMGREAMLRVVSAIADRNFDVLFDTIDKTVRSSKDILVFWQELISLYRDILVVRTTKNASAYLDLTDSEKQMLEDISKRFDKETVMYHCHLLDEAYMSMQKANSVKRVVAEMTLVRMCDPVLDTSNEALLSRMARIEERVASLSFVNASDQTLTTPNIKSIVGSADKGQISSLTYEKDMPFDKSLAEAGMSSNNLQTRTLRPVRVWNEAVERVKGTNPMAASFFKQAKAYSTDNDIIIVKFASDFEHDMASRDGAPEAIRAALSVCLQKPLGSKNVLFEVDTTKNNNRTLDWMDKIIEAAEEQ